MTVKELQQGIINNLKNWQKIESQSVSKTAQVIEKTGNPIILLVMEIIQRDSQMHYRVQEWIAASLERIGWSLSPDDLNEVWHIIQQHIELEKKMIESAQEQLSKFEGKRGMLVQQYFIKYLLEDETKHSHLLEYLESVKKGMRDSE